MCAHPNHRIWYARAGDLQTLARWTFQIFLSTNKRHSENKYRIIWELFPNGGPPHSASEMMTTSTISFLVIIWVKKTSARLGRLPAAAHHWSHSPLHLLPTLVCLINNDYNDNDDHHHHCNDFEINFEPKKGPCTFPGSCPASWKTLPEAQQTQGIAYKTWVISPAKLNVTCIG